MAKASIPASASLASRSCYNFSISASIIFYYAALTTNMTSAAFFPFIGAFSGPDIIASFFFAGIRSIVSSCRSAGALWLCVP